MKDMLTKVVAYLVANSVGLLIAALLLPEFTIAVSAFVIAVLIFSVAEAVAGPVVKNLSTRYAPQLLGGIALVTIFVGLLITSALVGEFRIGGISNLLAATLLIWLGTLAADIAMQVYGFTDAPAARDPVVKDDAAP